MAGRFPGIRKKSNPFSHGLAGEPALLFWQLNGEEALQHQLRLARRSLACTSARSSAAMNPMRYAFTLVYR